MRSWNDLHYAIMQKTKSETPPGTLPPLNPAGVIDAPRSTPQITESQDIWIGVDVGSVSAKLAAVNRDGQLVAKDYRMTEGRPLEAVTAMLDDFNKRSDASFQIKGVGVTGSGRDFLAHYLNADLTRNEITAQAAGAMAAYPKVKSIIEIGGQDSKYIRIENGTIVDFVMNKTCAAGTGSFLAEQADRLHIPLTEFSDLAFASDRPLDLGTRCTVFMETDCIHHQQNGAPKRDLLAGLSYAIARNYLEKVVGNRPFEGPIVIQGGIAFNPSVVAAFSELLKQPITIAPHHEITGALGMALITLQLRGEASHSAYAGLDLQDRVLEQKTSQCGGCSNSCGLIHMKLKDGRSSIHGGSCGKFEGSRTAKGSGLNDYFEFRKRMLEAYLETPLQPKSRIGIPRTLLFHELFPLWASFFQTLGHEVVLSKPLSKEVHEKGLAKVLVDTCFPIRTLTGAVTDLQEQGVDQVFLPYVLDLENQTCGSRFSHNCQYIQQVPDLIRASMDVNILSHTVRFQDGPQKVEEAFLELGQKLGADISATRWALRRGRESQLNFEQSCHELGNQALKDIATHPKALVLIGHPYIVHDPFFNLNLAKRLSRAGIPAIPGDILPRTIRREQRPLDLAWKSNNRSLDILEYVSNYNQQHETQLLPVLLTQFGCAADSMLTPYVDSLMDGHPWLELEVDEHNSATGMMTRCEAFWESVNAPKCPAADFDRATELAEPSLTLKDVVAQNRTIYMLPFCEAAYVIPEVLKRFNVPCEMLPKTTLRSNNLGRQHSNEKHCRTYQVVLGDLMDTVLKPGFDASKAAIFMFDYEEACRLSLFRPLYEKVLKEHGAEGIRMFGTLVDDPVGWILAFGPRIATELWVAMIAADYLFRFRYEKRPYEREAGSVDRAYEEALQIFYAGVRKGRFMEPFTKAMKHLAQVPTVDRDLVRVGVIGDAFTRVHEYGMNEIFETVESMGGVLVMPPSWHDFINYGSQRRAGQQFQRGRMARALATKIGSLTLDQLRRRMQRVAQTYSPSFKEPTNKELTRLSTRYVNVKVAPVIPSMFVGKTVDFVVSKQVHGLVNAYGFNCCLGKITTACIHRLRQENNDMPMFTFIDDGLQQTNIRTRVEAFMEQAWAYKRKTDALPLVASE